MAGGALPAHDRLIRRHRRTFKAQLLLQRVGTVELVEVDELEDSDRGETGFGSSGTR